MTIVILIPWFAPAFKAGGPIQSISTLVENYQSATFRIFTSNRDMDGTILPVETNKWIRFNDRTEVWYASHKSIGMMKKQLTATNPDLLFINGLFDWYFNLVPMLGIKAKRKIISARGMLHPNALHQKPFKKKLYLQLLKQLKVPQKYDFHGTNQEEIAFIETALPLVKKTFMAPNYPRLHPLQPIRPKVVGALKMASIALISPMKNHLMVLQALQKMEEKIAYDIYGPIKDAGYWKECLEVINNMPANITVTYRGEINPREVLDKIALCDVFMAPSESENYGHSIVEALSAGRPVITSTGVPWLQLEEEQAGVNVRLQEKDALQRIIAMFAGMEEEELKKWSTRANAYILNKLDREEITKRYDEMFKGCFL